MQDIDMLVPDGLRLHQDLNTEKPCYLTSYMECRTHRRRQKQKEAVVLTGVLGSVPLVYIVRIDDDYFMDIIALHDIPSRQVMTECT